MDTVRSTGISGPLDNNKGGPRSLKARSSKEIKVRRNQKGSREL